MQPTRSVAAFLHVPAQFGKPAMKFPIYPGLSIVGKNKGDLQLQHDFVSGIHAHIEISEDGSEHWLEDLESTNGTYFGDAPVAIRPRRFYQLTNGRLLRFGRIYATFELATFSVAATSSKAGIIMNLTTDATELLQHENHHGSPHGSAKNSISQPLTDDMSCVRDSLQSFPFTKSPTFPSVKDMKAIEFSDDNEQPEKDDFIKSESNNDVDDDVEELEIIEDVIQSPVPIPDFIEKPSSPLVSTKRSITKRPSTVTSAQSSRSSSPILSHKENSEHNTSSVRSEMVSQSLVDDSSSRPVSPVNKENIEEKPKLKRGRKKIFNSKPKEEESEIAPIESIDSIKIPVVVEKKKRARAKKETVAEEIMEDVVVIKAETPPAAKKRRTSNDAAKPTRAKKTKSSSSAGISIAFTGLPDHESFTKPLKSLGIKIVTNHNTCNYLISDKIKRTTKFLCALSSGKQIVSIDWVHDCLKEKKVLGIFFKTASRYTNEEITSAYILSDPENEKKWNFSLRESLKRVEDRGASKLFQGMKFMITPSTIPEFEDMKDIIEAGGGTVIINLPGRVTEDVYIIGCPEDKDLIKQYVEVGWKDKVMKTEFILASSLCQKLDYETEKFW